MAEHTAETETAGKQTNWVRFLAAQLPPLVALAAQWILWPILQPLLWFCFYPAVFFSSWIGGLAGGITASILSMAIVLIVFAPPEWSFGVQDPKAYLSATVFFGMGVLFSLFHERLRKANRRAAESLASAEAARNGLEQRVRERTAELVQSNELLQISQERVNLLIYGVKDYAIFLLDTEGRVASWNDGAARIKGYQSEEILGKHFSCFYSEEEKQAGKPERVLSEAISTGRYEEEAPRLRRDGSAFWAHVVVSPLHDEAGKVRGFSKIVRDITQHKVAEQELRILAAVAQNSRDFIGVCTPDLQAIYVNEAGLRMVGLNSIEEAKQTSVLDYFWHEDREMIEREALPALVRDGSWRGEVRFRHFKTGEPIHTVWDAFAIRDDAGKIAGWATISPNLERWRKLQMALSDADKLLRESQARQAGIIASAMDAIISIDSEQRIVVFNAAAEQMFLCSAADALGHSISRFIPERYRATHATHVRQFGEMGMTTRHMGRRSFLWAQRTDGQEFQIESSISQMEAGGKKLFTVIVRDVTERLKITEALRQSDAMRRFAMESAQLGESVAELATGKVQRSAMMSRLYGYHTEPKEWSYEIAMQHIHPEDRERVDSSFKKAIQEEERWNCEYRVVWPDSSVHWVRACAALFRDQTGKTTHLIATMGDVSEQKRAEQTRLRSQKLEGLGTLAGGIAHDFNNMLMAIAGNVKMATTDLSNENPVQEYLTEISKAAARATDLVRRILAFSRPQELKREVIALQPVVEEALKLVRATLPAWIEFRTEFVPSLPAILADATQIHQVIVNLATNAAHAIGQKSGLIQFRLDECSMAEAELRPRYEGPPGRFVRLAVSDSGCGIERVVLDRIFDPFFTTKAPGEGTGLGLSVVHGIITNHGGTVHVYSDPGRGTAFHLYFPAVGSAPAVTAPKQSELPRDRHQHILYVDDEEGLVLLATRMLKRLGYKVSGFTDAGSALREFRNAPENFDVVITDLSMPSMSGFEVASKLLAVRPKLPVILTSGYLRPEDQERAQRLGIEHFLQKPHSVEEVAQVLDQIFQRVAELAKPR